MNIARVSLTKDEAIWFSRYIIKMIVFMETAGKKDPAILERTTYKTLVSLKQKAEIFSTTENEVQDASLNRKQKLLMQDLIGGVQKSLNNAVIPEYKKRGGHEKYLKAAEEQSAFFDKLIRKFR